MTISLLQSSSSRFQHTHQNLFFSIPSPTPPHPFPPNQKKIPRLFFLYTTPLLSFSFFPSFCRASRSSPRDPRSLLPPSATHTYAFLIQRNFLTTHPKRNTKPKTKILQTLEGATGEAEKCSSVTAMTIEALLLLPVPSAPPSSKPATEQNQHGKIPTGPLPRKGHSSGKTNQARTRSVHWEEKPGQSWSVQWDRSTKAVPG